MRKPVTASEQPVLGLFLGLTTIDLQYLVDPFPHPNTKNKAIDFEIAVGGPAVNAAAAFAALGGKAQAITVIGSHAMREYVIADFDHYQVEWKDLSPDHPYLPTVAAVLSSQTNGDRTIVTNRRVPAPLNLEMLGPECLEGIDIVLLDGFHMEAAIQVAGIARRRGIPVVMDGGSWKEGMEILLPEVDIAICSADFAVPDGKPVFAYLREAGVQMGAITHGGASIHYYSEGREGVLPVSAVEVVDTLGAGDIFHGAFCHRYVGTDDFIKSMKEAAVIAGESCTCLGAKTWIDRRQNPD